MSHVEITDNPASPLSLSDRGRHHVRASIQTSMYVWLQTLWLPEIMGVIVISL